MCCFKLNCLANALGQSEHLYFLIGPECDSSELEELLVEPALEPSLSLGSGALKSKDELSANSIFASISIPISSGSADGCDCGDSEGSDARVVYDDGMLAAVEGSTQKSSEAPVVAVVAVLGGACAYPYG